MFKWLSQIIEWLLALVLIGVGLLGALHEVLDYAGVHLHDPSSFTLRIAGLLALALGLERFTRFASFDRHAASFEKRFDALQSEIHERLSVRVSEGYEKVYDDGIEMLRTSESSIRTLVYANKPVAPERFAEAVIEHLRTHKMVTYDVTIALDLSTASENFWDVVAKRDALYKKAEVASRVHLTILNTTKPIGFDVLVIDERHCAVSLSPAPDAPETNKEFAISFEEQPKIAKRMRAWMNSLHPVLLKLEDAKKEWSKRHKVKSATC